MQQAGWRRFAVALLAELAVAGSVRAEPTTTTATAAATVAPLPASANLSQDPHADRVIVGSTATTQPAGSVYFSDYDVAVVQMGYAFTDRTQISVTFTPPVEAAKIVPLDVTLKTSLYRAPRIRVAATGSASGLTGIDDVGAVMVGRAGAMAQFCLRDGCDSSLVVSSNFLLAGVVVNWNSVGAILRLSSWAQLLVEADTILPLGRLAGQVNAGAFGAGLRFPGRRWSFDVALMRTPKLPKVPVIPIVALTFRP